MRLCTATSRSRRSTSATPRRQTTRLESGGLFIFIGADAQTAWLPPEIALDHHGFVLTDSDMRAAGAGRSTATRTSLETSVPGIFACGDVRFAPVKRVAAAVGEGAMAIAFVHQYLRDAGAVEGTPSAEPPHGDRSALVGEPR